MLENKAKCYAFTTKEEGGYSSDARDPGNWTGGRTGSGKLIGTIYGISAPVLAQKYPNIDAAGVKALPESAFPAVGDTYWNGVWGDKLPSGLDLMCFDFAYNAGIPRAVRILQTALGVTQDGVIGSDTMRALTAYLYPQQKPTCPFRKLLPTKPTGTPGSDLIMEVYALQLKFYQDLPGFPIFGGGWTRRTNARRDTALTMETAAGMNP